MFADKALQISATVEPSLPLPANQWNPEYRYGRIDCIDKGLIDACRFLPNVETQKNFRRHIQQQPAVAAQRDDQDIMQELALRGQQGGIGGGWQAIRTRLARIIEACGGPGGRKRRDEMRYRLTIAFFPIVRRPS